MMILASPNAVPAYWEVIKYGIRKCGDELALLTDSNLNNLLNRILSLDAQVWIAMKNETDMYGFVVTFFNIDPLTGVKTLVIYALYSFETAPKEVWQEGFATLHSFAKRNECSIMRAFTNNPRIEDLTSEFFHIKYQVLETYV